MSVFYDLASLVLVPSGYKASKVYAQKPLTTDGQLAFSRASTATRVNSAGLIETVSSNVPRLDYLNSSCPRLLLEPQRTNSLTYSEQFDNAAWTKSNATVTANTSVSPDGYTNADTVVITSGGYLYREINGYSAVSGQSVAYSVFAKNQTANFLIFGGATPAGTDVYKIENYGNGWYRHSVVRTFTTTTTGTLQYLIAYEIVGTHIIWGAQIEGSNSAYPTSYIPTEGTTVTRLADTASKTGVSSLVGGTEGTMFVEGFQNSPATCVPFQLSDGTNNNRVQIEISSVGAPLCVVASGGATQAVIVGSSKAVGTNRKIAITFKANEFKLYENGQLIGTDTSGSIPVSLSAIYLGSESGSVYTGFTYKQILDFKTALTEAQAKELTAL